MNKTKTLAVTGTITFFATCALWIAGLALLYGHFMDSPSFAVTIDAPNEIKKNEIFTISIDVANPSEEKITLGSIDVYDSLLEGFEIIKIEPTPYEVSSQFGFQTAYFSQEIDPRDSFNATYTLKAKSAGLWIGDIDCCTPSEKFVTTSKSIVVIEK